MKLYEISEQYKQIQALAESDDNNMVDAIANTIEGIEADFSDKAQAVVATAINIESILPGIDEQIKRLQEKKRLIIARADRLRSYLRSNMDATGINKIECPLFIITLSQPTSIVEITDEASIPDDYIVVKTEVKPDKAMIAKALKDGVEIPGARLSDGMRRLIIR